MKRLLASLACAALAALTLPSGAAAKPGYYVFKPQRFAVIFLPASNGYQLQVAASTGSGIDLVGFGGGTSVVYNVPGGVNDERVAANFSRFGRIEVRFQPSEPPQPEGTYPSCEGKAPTRQDGNFVGVIRFRSEKGLISVRERSVEGAVFRSYRLVCRREPGSAARLRHWRGYSLSAVPKGRPTAPWFSVFKEDPNRHSRTHFNTEDANYRVSATERRGRMTVYRNAFASTEPETFAIEPLGANPTIATVAPPRPFSGSARFERLPNGSSRWEGDLAVELPEMGTVPLTGGDYEANLCRGFDCACPTGKCAFVVFGSGRRQLARGPQRLPYGSGSHSQPLALARLSSLR